MEKELDAFLQNVNTCDHSTMNETMREAISRYGSKWGATQVYYYIKRLYEKNIN